MKRNLLTILVCLMMVVISTASGCTSNTGTAKPSQSIAPDILPDVENTSTSLSATLPKWKIEFYHLHISNASAVFEARTDLSEGSIIMSQIYRRDENDQKEKAETWWPSNKEFIVVNGHITISVVSGEDVVQVELTQGPSYHLKVWAKDHPEITGNSYFDLNGPP
jgi:hypothetical protein